MRRRTMLAAVPVVLLALMANLTLAVTAPSRAAPYTAKGPERKTILESMRGPVAAKLGAPIEFVVDRILIDGDWAFAVVTPQRPGGGKIDFRGTVCAGDVSHLVGALFKRAGIGWTVRDIAFCPTDVAWANWDQQHGAPAALFR